MPLLANPGEIEIKKQILNDNGEIEDAALDHVIRLYRPEKSEFNDTRVELQFDKSTGEFEKEVSMAIKKATNKYRFCPLDAKIPFYQEDTDIDFVLFGHSISPGSRAAIKELRSVDPNQLGADELFRYYAKARVQAEYVLKNVKDTNSSSRDNVKAVYSFLQAVNNLANTRYIEPDDIAIRSASQLSNTCKINGNLCDNAVGEGNWEKVLDEFKALEAYRYEDLYAEILRRRTVDFDVYCEIMVSLQDSFEKMQDDEIKRINRKKVTAQVSLAVAACYAKSAWGVAYKDAFNEKDRDEVLKRQMLVIERQLNSDVVMASKWPGLASMLRGHKQDLQNLLHD